MKKINLILVLLFVFSQISFAGFWVGYGAAHRPYAYGWGVGYGYPFYSSLSYRSFPMSAATTNTVTTTTTTTKAVPVKTANTANSNAANAPATPNALTVDHQEHAFNSTERNSKTPDVLSANPKADNSLELLSYMGYESPMTSAEASWALVKTNLITSATLFDRDGLSEQSFALASLLYECNVIDAYVSFQQLFKSASSVEGKIYALIGLERLGRYEDFNQLSVTMDQKDSVTCLIQGKIYIVSVSSFWDKYRKDPNLIVLPYFPYNTVKAKTVLPKAGEQSYVAQDAPNNNSQEVPSAEDSQESETATSTSTTTTTTTTSVGTYAYYDTFYPVYYAPPIVVVSYRPCPPRPPRHLRPPRPQGPPPIHHVQPPPLPRIAGQGSGGRQVEVYNPRTSQKVAAQPSSKNQPKIQNPPASKYQPNNPSSQPSRTKPAATSKPSVSSPPAVRSTPQQPTRSASSRPAVRPAPQPTVRSAPPARSQPTVRSAPQAQSRPSYTPPSQSRRDDTSSRSAPPPRRR